MKRYKVGINTKFVGKNGEDRLSYSRAWTSQEITLAQLAEHIGLGHPWMPGNLDKNSRRRQTSANYAEVLAIDIDGVITIQQAMQLPIVQSGCGLIIESSSSTPELHKFRLVFPLPTPLTTWQEIRLANIHLIDVLRAESGVSENKAIDGQCKDSSRFFFGGLGRTPALLNDSAGLTLEFIKEANDKESAAIAAWEAGKAERERQAASMDKTSMADRAWRALQFIPPYTPGNGTYNDLITMAAGVVNTLGSEGERLLELWGGFGPVTGHKVSGLIKSRPQSREASISSLFYLARQHGYTLNKEEKREYAQSLEVLQAASSVKPSTNAQQKQIAPIALYATTKPDLDMGDFVAVCEASNGKPESVASRFGVPVIGAIGSNFKGFEKFYLESGRKHLVLVPDAGAIFNTSIVAQYKKLAEWVELHNAEEKARNPEFEEVKLSVLWWDQFTKSDADANELTNEKTVMLTWKQFFSCTIGTDRRYAQNWIDSRTFTADEVRTSRYCDFQLPERGQLLCIKAGLGLGKTHRIIDLINAANVNVLSFNPTNNLCLNFNRRAEKKGIASELVANLTNDDKNSNTKVNASAATVITLCPDSILSINIEGMADAVLVIDEAIETCSAFTQRKTHIKSIRREAIEHLSALLHVCKGVILLDGNLADETIQWFHDLCPSLTTYKIEYSHRAPMQYVIELGSKEQFIGRLSQSLKQEASPIFFATDSKADTCCTQYALNADTVKESMLDALGKMVDSPAQLIRDDVAAFIKKFDLQSLAISPAAGAGWDCSVGDHFKQNYLMGVGVLPVNGLLQMSARDRNTEPVRQTWIESQGLHKYWVIDYQTFLPAEMEKIYLRNQAERAGSLFMPLDRQFKIREMALIDFISSDPTARLVSRQAATSNFEEFHLRGCFIWAALQAGHSVSLVLPLSDDEYKELASEHKEAKKAIKKEFAASSLKAEAITDEQADIFKQASRVAPGVRAQMNRHAVEKMLPGISEQPIWTDETLDEKAGTIANVEFMVKASTYAQRATDFFFLVHPNIATRKEQHKFQHALNSQYLDLTNLNDKYTYTDKVRKLLLKIDSDFVGLSLHDDVPQSLATYSIEAFSNFSGSLVNKKQQKAIVEALLHGANRKTLGKKTHEQFIAIELKKLGYAVAVVKKPKQITEISELSSKTAEVGDLWVTAPFLEAGTIENQCYECVCQRFTMDAEEPAEMVWNISEEPIAVSESLALMEEFRAVCEGLASMSIADGTEAEELCVGVYSA